MTEDVASTARTEVLVARLLSSIELDELDALLRQAESDDDMRAHSFGNGR